MKNKIILILVIGGILTTSSVFAADFTGSPITKDLEPLLVIMEKGVEYIGFSNNQDKTDYDARIVLSGDDELKIEDASLSISDAGLQVSGPITSIHRGNEVTINPDNDNNPVIVLRDNGGGGGNPYINFVNDPDSDGDAFIILTKDDLLEIMGAGLQVSGPISARSDLNVSGTITADTITTQNIIMPSDGMLCIGACANFGESVVGEVQWMFRTLNDKISGYMIKVIDPDVSDSVTIHVRSDSDANGIEMKLMEDGYGTGIFTGRVIFHPGYSNNGGQMHAKIFDTVIAEYKDYTLPDSFTENDLVISDSVYIDFLVEWP
ncbi:MAG: hypothetical protein OER82_11570 [Nitrosopumilus sp.]|nr:hypothetical protein [Nitrosopumilus sp.]